MATIKVFDVNGVRELSCFDTLDYVPYEDLEEDIEVEDELSAVDDTVSF